MAFYRIIPRPNFRALERAHIILDYCVISNENKVYSLPRDVQYNSYAEVFSAWRRLHCWLYTEGKEPQYAQKLPDDGALGYRAVWGEYLLEI